MKNFTLSLLLIGGTYTTYAQSHLAEMAPLADRVSHPLVDNGNRAMFDIQFDEDPQLISPGLAGCYWTGTEFWVSRWGIDSVFTLDITGALNSGFVIPGVTGVRGITSDGTDIYVAVNTNTIYRVDMTTKTVLSTITSAAPHVSRYLTYDASLNGGAGGFWTGTFTSNWTAISMSGAVLSSISSATHGLVGVYGLAYDNFTPGGPFLWAYDQGTAGDEANIIQYNMSGAQTGIIHSTQSDLTGAPNTGIAGGLCVVDDFVAGTISIGGISQLTSLFMYELIDFATVNENTKSVAGINVYPNPANTLVNVGFGLSTPQDVKIEVYSITGIMAYSSDVKRMDAGNQTILLNTANFKSGVYTVKLITEKETFTSQLSVTN